MKSHCCSCNVCRPSLPPPLLLLLSGQVTHHQLQLQQEADQEQREAEQRERTLAARRDVTADSYSRLVDAENTNRQEDTVDARSMEQAIDALQSIKVAEASPADRHPEK
jgi:hypothetical protein